MVRGAQSERLVQLLDASDEVQRGSERCLKPSVRGLGVQTAWEGLVATVGRGAQQGG